MGLAAKRRTQEERTTETRGALMQAAVATIQRLGYGGATTAIIAEEAGVSRGALTHHFGSRTDLMAAVVQWVYDGELVQYAELIEARGGVVAVADWPDLIWAVLSRPGGVAVMEILQATRADAELAERVKPIQAAIEKTSFKMMRRLLGGDERTREAFVRLMVWTIRGLTVERLLTPEPDAVRDAVDVLRVLLANTASSGTLADVHVDFQRSKTVGA